MKKYLGIFFLSIYLLSSTYGIELFKLPFLFDHFQEHKAKNSSIDFVDFLKMHYAKSNTKDADYQKDMKLPFKTISSGNVITVFLFQENIPFDIERKHDYTNSIQPIFKKYAAPLSKSALFSIWNPPKFTC
jgi:hypothetical protein